MPIPVLWDPSHFSTVITHCGNTFCLQRVIVALATFKVASDFAALVNNAEKASVSGTVRNS